LIASPKVMSDFSPNERNNFFATKTSPIFFFKI
jgi:hypothetical protein